MIDLSQCCFSCWTYLVFPSPLFLAPLCSLYFIPSYLCILHLILHHPFSLLLSIQNIAGHQDFYLQSNLKNIRNNIVSWVKYVSSLRQRLPVDTEATQKARFLRWCWIYAAGKASVCCVPAASVCLSVHCRRILKGGHTAKPKWRRGAQGRPQSMVLPRVPLSLFSSYKIWAILQKSLLGRWWV